MTKKEVNTNKIIRFIAAGLFSATICISIQWLGIEILKQDKLPSIAISAFTSNFAGWILNRKITFRSNNHIPYEIAKYTILNISSSTIATTVVYAFIYTGMHYIAASLTTAIFFTAINYAIHSKITFAKNTNKK